MSSPDTIGTFARLWPDPKERRAVAALLADSVRTAHLQGDRCWVLTVDRTSVRLNVGQVQLVRVSRDSAHVYVARPVDSSPFEIISRPGNVYSDRAVEVPLAIVDIPISRLSRIPGRILKGHRTAVESAARAKAVSPWGSRMATSALEEIERLTRLKLPRPSSRRYWVVKGRPGDNDFARMLDHRHGSWRTAQPPAKWARGDRLFIWQSSPELRIVGLGEITRIPPKAPRHDVVRASVRFLTPFLEEPVPADVIRQVRELRGATFLKSGPAYTFFEVNADQASRLLQLVVSYNPDLDEMWPEFQTPSEATAIADAYDNSVVGSEGARRRRVHYRRERNQWLIRQKRQAVFARTGALRCQACGFDFKKVYGSLGEGFCEVHHLEQLSKARSERITSLGQLAVLCANCHRMVHRSDEMLTPVQLKTLIQRQRGRR